MNRRLAIGNAIFALAMAFSLDAWALPRNTHQVAEGYWIGAAPLTALDIEDLHARGVRVIVSGVVLAEEPRLAARRLGMERVNVWFGCHFPSIETLMAGVAGHVPAEIFIHCDYGGDRAGALLAFLLAVQHGWQPDHAILAVAYPGERDVSRLIALLEEQGFCTTEEERTLYLGIYSGARNGGAGGLKVRGDDYRTLVVSTLEAMGEVGVSLVDSLGPTCPVDPAAIAGDPDDAQVHGVQPSTEGTSVPPAPVDGEPPVPAEDPATSADGIHTVGEGTPASANPSHVAEDMAGTLGYTIQE